VQCLAIAPLSPIPMATLLRSASDMRMPFVSSRSKSVLANGEDYVPKRPSISAAAAAAAAALYEQRGLLEYSDEDEEDVTHPNEGSFTVTLLKRSSKKWDLTCDYSTENCVQVIRIGRGAVDAYNGTVMAERQVLVHDLILMVNGKTTADEIKQAIAEGGKLSMVILRPTRHRVRLDKSEGGLGLTLNFRSQISTCLQVRQVVGGAASAYNSRTHAVAQLTSRSFIEKANGVSGSGEALMAELRAATIADIVVLRYPGLPCVDGEFDQSHA
jgi:hypothetical protein